MEANCTPEEAHKILSWLEDNIIELTTDNGIFSPGHDGTSITDFVLNSMEE